MRTTNYQTKNYCKKIIFVALILAINFSFAVRPSFAVDVVVMAIFGDMAILKVDGAKHKLKVGDKTPQGITLAEIDYDTVVLLNGRKKSRHKLGGHTSFGNLGGRKDKNLKNAIAKIWPQGDMYVTTGSINKFSVQFMVDTGATWVAMSTADAKRMGINYYRGTTGYAGTASGTTRVYKVNLDTVRVGDITLHNVAAAVIPRLSGPILLGNSFLKRVEIQRTKQVMILKKKY